MYNSEAVQACTIVMIKMLFFVILLVGMSTKEEDYLKFLFELSDDFSVIPSFGVVPSFPALAGLANVTQLSIDFTQVHVCNQISHQLLWHNSLLYTILNIYNLYKFYISPISATCYGYALEWHSITCSL